MFLEKRFCNSSKISGIHGHYYFILNFDGTLKMERVTGDECTDEIIINVSNSIPVANNSLLDELIPGQFILCKYETDLRIGNFREFSFENEDVLVSFMHPKITSGNFH